MARKISRAIFATSLRPCARLFISIYIVLNIFYIIIRTKRNIRSIQCIYRCISICQTISSAHSANSSLYSINIQVTQTKNQSSLPIYVHTIRIIFSCNSFILLFFLLNQMLDYYKRYTSKSI